MTPYTKALAEKLLKYHNGDDAWGKLEKLERERNQKIQDLNRKLGAYNTGQNFIAAYNQARERIEDEFKRECHKVAKEHGLTKEDEKEVAEELAIEEKNQEAQNQAKKEQDEVTEEKKEENKQEAEEKIETKAKINANDITQPSKGDVREQEYQRFLEEMKAAQERNRTNERER